MHSSSRSTAVIVPSSVPAWQMGLVVVVVAGAVFPADVSPIRQAILNNDDAY